MTRMEAEKRANELDRMNRDKGASIVALELAGKWSVCFKKGADTQILEQ
jgi:hypothetical protein